MKTIKTEILFIISLFFIFPLYSESDFPNFALYDLSGNRKVFSGIQKEEAGKILVLNFTSVDCLPCKKEIPELLEFQKKSKKMKLFCIFAESDSIAKPVAESLGLTTAYSDPMENVQKIFNVKSSYPTTVVIQNGKILSTLVGYNEENTKLLKKMLEK